MASRIEYASSALKALKKLDKHIAKTIVDYLDENVAPLDDPAARGESLTSSLAGLHRYRIGDYRAICYIEKEIVTILVLRISHRKEVYIIDQKKFADEAQAEIQRLQQKQQQALANDSPVRQSEFPDEQI